MKVLDVFGMAKERKKGERRMDLFRRENLDTWILLTNTMKDRIPMTSR